MSTSSSPCPRSPHHTTDPLRAVARTCSIALTAFLGTAPAPAVQFGESSVPITHLADAAFPAVRRQVVRPPPPPVVAPRITAQPVNVTASVGQSATFSVTAAGTPPLRYQWRRNGASIADATSASYATPAAGLLDNGALYSVVVRNAIGNVASAEAVLTVTPSTVTPVLSRTVVRSGLSSPWDLAFLPDGSMLITEKCRGLSILRNGALTRLFGTSGASLVAGDLFCQGQSGMHGVAVDPEFGNGNRYVYVYMASNASTNPRTNRVVRLTLSADLLTASGRVDIITDIAFKDVANSWGGAGSHSGGRLRFGPDGLLYVTTGDNHNGTLPQDLTRMGGKVLRVTPTGSAALGNNSPGDPRIYTFGHRNVQGISFRPGTGQPYTSEHGPGHSDEVTPLVAGGNGGWDPKPEPGVSCADNYCGYTSNKLDGTPTPMTDTAKFPTAMRPSWNNSGRSQGTGPSTFLNGPQWKAWDGRLAVGVMGDMRLDILQLDATGRMTSQSTATGLPAQRMRSLVQGPDGYLYVATDSGEIWRLVPN
ncbi:MAG: hypothetical protein NFCOHLIN_02064 [Gammaproteobacteria bacterium]|nr:hypothetical protein [Gammaproteobacteria bacterium]